MCTKCSGLHRELQFKIKGMSLSNFTEEEVALLATVGNTKFNEIYLAKYDQPAPAYNDPNRFKEYLRQKYVDKRWTAKNSYDRSGSPGSGKGTPDKPITINLPLNKVS